MINWDIFISEYLISNKNSELNFISFELFFKKKTISSYYRFRELFQIIDLSIFDFQSMNYSQRMIAASALYLVIIVKINKLKDEKSEKYFIETIEMQGLYNDFLINSFDFCFRDLSFCIQYLKHLFCIPFIYEIPPCKPLNFNSEELYSIQFHSKSYVNEIDKVIFH